MSTLNPTTLADLLNSDAPNAQIHDKLLDEGIDVAEVYVVVGYTGEYSDHRWWYVAAFLFREPADAMCARLNAWARDHGVHDEETNYRKAWDNVQKLGELKPPDDPGFQIQRSVYYEVVDISLRSS